MINALLTIDANIRDASARFSFDATQAAGRIEDWVGVLAHRGIDAATEARVRKDSALISDSLMRWLRQEPAISEIGVRHNSTGKIEAVNRDEPVRYVLRQHESAFSEWRKLRMANALPVQLRLTTIDSENGALSLLSVRDESTNPAETQLLLSKNYLDRLARSHNPEANSVLLVIGDKQRLVASSHTFGNTAFASEAPTGLLGLFGRYISQYGLSLHRDPNGQHWVGAERAVTSVPWRVHVRAPAVLLMSNLYAVLWWNLAIVGIGLSASLYFALRSARHLSQPVKELHKILLRTRSARGARGNTQSTQADELDQLLRMAPEIERELKASYEDLEQRVKEKTFELQHLNETLESRVAEKIREVERLSHLARFVPAAVAKRIVNGERESPLASRRRDVAVVFVDLRGFTAFSQSFEAGVVMDVLRRFHLALGLLIDRFGATVERFTGDGVMVFFNDPEPIEEPCRIAIEFAMETRSSIVSLLSQLAEEKISLGVGIGVAFGPATVGAVGYATRIDYGAIGPVTNLASRLCALATSGEIIVDEQAYVLARIDASGATKKMVTVKGYDIPVSVVSLPQSLMT